MSYRNQLRCRCPRCTIRALMGPAVLITIGILFLLQEMRGGYLDFGNTYPVILIVIGAILLGSAVAPADSCLLQPAAPPASGSPASPPQDPAPGQGQ